MKRLRVLASLLVLPALTAPVRAFTPFPPCPECGSIAECAAAVDKEPRVWPADRCRRQMSVQLGGLYQSNGQRDKAVEIYRDQARQGNVDAVDKLKELGEPVSMPWTPFKFTILPPNYAWPKRPAVYGLSLGPLIAENPLSVGLQIGGFESMADRVYGAQIAGGVNGAKRVVGAQIAMLANYADGVDGLQTAFFNWQIGTSRGLQAGGVNIHDRFIGLQIGAFNSANDLTGLSLGAVNGFRWKFQRSFARVHGVQLGAINIADKVDGAQIGLINACNSLHGLQLGLVNQLTESDWPWLPMMRLSL